MTDREFPKFQKVPRWSRDIVVTEKLDGTNALVDIEEVENPLAVDYTNDPYVLGVFGLQDGTGLVMRAGSRERWLCPKTEYVRVHGGPAPETDNYGFSAWVKDNANELFKLGPGTHYGEWWGQGIGRKYDGRPRAFSLFNVGRWATLESRPACCEVVPTLYIGANHDAAITVCLDTLTMLGSQAAPGFMRPEGIVIFHTASGQLYKKLLEKDELPKALAEVSA